MAKQYLLHPKDENNNYIIYYYKNGAPVGRDVIPDTELFHRIKAIEHNGWREGYNEVSIQNIKAKIREKETEWQAIKDELCYWVELLETAKKNLIN